MEKGNSVRNKLTGEVGMVEPSVTHEVCVHTKTASRSLIYHGSAVSLSQWWEVI